MSNFNYCNYIGEHMDEPLEVLENGTVLPFGLLTISYTYPSKSMLLESHSDEEYRGVEDCKPLIKSPSDLTDEEWLFVVYGDNIPEDTLIERLGDNVYLDTGNCVDLLLNGKIGTMLFWTQAMYNRLYSLHVSLDYEELIKNNKAVRKG